MIRQQQLQLQQLQAAQGQAGHGNNSNSTVAVIDEPSAGGAGSSMPGSASFPPRSPGWAHPHHHPPRSSFDMARADIEQRRRSRTPSRSGLSPSASQGSPRLRSTSIERSGSEGLGLPAGLAGRDESAFYQAETQMLMRENQMLRHRIRDLGESLF